MTLRGVIDGMARLFGKARAERELDEELRHYLSLAVEEKVRSGLPLAEAERIARVEMGGIEATKERVRSGGWEAHVETFVQDARYALRGLRRNPAFTVIAVLTLALGIGANSAMFSVVSAVLLRPLPYRDANALALIWTDDIRRGLHREGTAYRTISDWRTENRSFVDVAYYSAGRITLGATAAGTGPRERSRLAVSSANLFSLLGVAPTRGRAISSDDEANAAPVAVISYGLWQRRYGGGDDVLGKTIGDDGDDKQGDRRFTIVGVMPQGFYFPDKQTELWAPATTYWRFRRESVERFPEWARRWTAVARLKPDVSMTDARADLGRVGRQLAATYRSSVPDFPGFATNVVPILDVVTGTMLQSALWILLGAVGLVLLVGCANVANLLLARGAVRQHEFAIRRAIGAGRTRLVRQLIVESLVLASLGGALGFALAVWGTRALSLAVTSRVPRIDEIGVDSRVLAFTAAISILAGIVFGLIPALRVSSVDPSEVLKESATRGGVRLRRGRELLVTAECALAIVLLTGAGLLLRSLGRLRAVDPGFDPRSVLAVRVEFPPQAPVTRGSPTNEPALARAEVQRLDDLVARLASLAGVESVGLIDDMFLTGQGHASITIPGRATDSLPEGELNAAAVTPGFFTAMRVPLRRGRQLTRDDALQKIRALWSGGERPQPTNAAPVLEPVVVNEAFVHRYFADDDPLGKRFLIDPTNKTYWYVIVGVVGDMRRQGLERQAIAEYYGAYVPRPLARADLLLRTQGNPIDIAPTVRAVIGQVLPSSLISGVSTADAQLGDFSAQRRFQTWLLSAFAALALLLAAVGIYGVVHYAVAERRREIGIRIALGASPADVMSMVVAQGMRMPVVGIIVGLAASAALSRLISHLLFGVGATDPATFVGVGLVLAVAAFAACYAPARRATTIDPVKTLRQD